MAPRSTRQVVTKILREIPGSIRALSRESGVDHATLLKIRAGELGLSDDAAKKLVAGLRQWGKKLRTSAEKCDRLARELETLMRGRRR